MTNYDCHLRCRSPGDDVADFGGGRSFVGGMLRKGAHHLSIVEGCWNTVDAVREGLEEEGSNIGGGTAVEVYQGIGEETHDAVEGPNVG